MIGLRKTILFGFYILVTGSILFYVLFPSDAVRDHLANRINQNVSDAQIAIGSLRLRLPPALSLGDVTILKNGAVLLSLDRMKVTPKWLSLLTSRKQLRFSGQAYHGEITGSLRGESDSNGLSASASGTFREIQLGQMPVIQRQSRLDLSGAITGSFQIDASSAQPATGSGSIVVSDCDFALPEELSDIQRLLNIEKLNFKRIIADLYIEGSSLEIQNGEFEGNQLKGHVSGSIYFETPMPRSELELEIAVTPLLSSSFSEINVLTFRVSGTFENPIISPVPTR